MAIYIPRPKTLRDAICALIFENGPQNHNAITSSFKGYRYNSVKAAIASLRDLSALELNEETGVYYLSGAMQKHYGQIAAEPVPEVAVDLVPSRTAIPFKPLKSLPWAQHLDKIRDISFHTASGAFQPLGYRA